MSNKRVMITLTSLGLSQIDAKVYIYLATNGPQNAEQIGDALKLKQQLLNQTIERLKDMGVVSSFLKQTTLLSALPFQQALEWLVKANLKKAKSIEEDKDEILSKWKTITEHS